MKFDTNKFENDKYFVGRYDDKPSGAPNWFIGDLDFFDADDPCRTNKVEIMYREHKKGDSVAPHYHQQKVEIMIVLEGKLKYNINGKDVFLEKGNFLFVDTNNILFGEFLEDSKIFAIHAPSIISDKVVVE